MSRFLRLFPFLFAPALAHAASWTLVSSPHFELFTTAGDRAGRDAILHFEQVRAFFLQDSPLTRTGDGPIRIVLFSTPAEFRPYRATDRGIAYYAPTRRCRYIALENFNPETYAVATHEFTHLMIDSQGWTLPAWLGEGWADVYSTLKTTGPGTVMIGDLIPGRVQTLRAGPWIPLSALTAAGRGSALYSGPRAPMFYAESWALVHMLYLSPDYGPGFGPFVTALASRRPLASALWSAYRRTLPQIESDLRRYLDRGQLYGLTFRVALPNASIAIRSQPAGVLDADLALAGLLGAVHRTATARSVYSWLRQRFPSNPRPDEAFGYFLWDLGDDNGARLAFARALDKGDRDPQTCYDFATLALQAGDSAHARAALNRALAIDPAFTQARLRLAEVRASRP